MLREVAALEVLRMPSMAYAERGKTRFFLSANFDDLPIRNGGTSLCHGNSTQSRRASLYIVCCQHGSKRPQVQSSRSLWYYRDLTRLA
jgi:hypothetical protein